jgi:hypothetical protein
LEYRPEHSGYRGGKGGKVTLEMLQRAFLEPLAAQP